MSGIISLPDPLKEFVDHQIAEGRYSTVSEYIRDLIRDDEKRKAEDRLEALLLEGLEGGADIPVTPESWRDLKAEARSIAAKHKARKRP